MTTTQRRRQTLIGLVLIVGFLLAVVGAMFALSALFGVAGVDGNAGNRACTSAQHLVVDPATGEGDCFWNSR